MGEGRIPVAEFDVEVEQLLHRIATAIAATAGDERSRFIRFVVLECRRHARARGFAVNSERLILRDASAQLDNVQ